MSDITYDLEADAAYVRLADGRVASTEEASPFLYDLDVDGLILGIEVLGATRTLAPGPWRHARLPGSSRADTAE
ncbi:DUF2283 domain-containing protein [Antarcticirhabdus aurantiaca]|uniref:DUF2283 domain-containing protein n=1 Tax=Antarcticirhabdus aurantiaca TaxID=2606717 RepID=A0ACD4NJE2_9HYPH|nr:DUF2283 domain-containing protein [Antarcticirhabdus aurantiaca]WAJ26939.1 DUF2283 domain-containing protein [Jeongeuplla avenae]